MISLLVFHATVTWALLGLIWTVQSVHYPLFDDVGRQEFSAYHQRHMARITWVVGPLMLAEVGSAGLLVCFGERSPYFLLSLAALAVIWVSTIAFQIPLHEKLTERHSSHTVGQLIRSNWWRTVAWTVRGLCVAAMLIQNFR
jgi:hypothetical protein